MYQQCVQRQGYVPNMDKLFSLAPQVRERWGAFLAPIRDPMDLRRSYCMLAHGEVLASKFHSPAEVAAIAADFRHAGLDARDAGG